MSAENETLVRRSWGEMVGAQNLDMLGEFYAADTAYHGPDGDLNGIAAIKEMIGGYFTAFPDVAATVEDLIASGDQVVARVTVRGTQTGPLGDFPASGKPIEMTIMQMVRIEDGRIVEEWETFDQLSMLQQVGAIPMEAQA